LKFISIRKKLITQVSIIFTLSFVLVLSLVAYMNSDDSMNNLAKSEKSIRSALSAKGKTLVLNNSQALRGMVVDNAFSAVKDLVSSTVKDDEDIVYGIFMDADSSPWVNANPENPSGNVDGRQTLDDKTSQWAAALKQHGNTSVMIDGVEVLEFAAPVILDNEILGVLRYGITTKSMKQSLLVASVESRKKLFQNIIVLVVVGLLAVISGFFATRKIASKISTPLNKLTTAAETIAAGDYSTAVSVVSDDEVGVLANNFEQMRITINKKMSDLATLNSVGEVLAVLLDQDKALEEVLKTMHRHCGVSQGSVFLMNKEEKLEVKAFFPPKNIKPEATSITFTMGEGILGLAAQEKQIVFIPDTSVDTRFTSAGSEESPIALLCIPLLDQDVLIGVMNFKGSVTEVKFEENDMEFASSVARLLVITIKNIRMREVIEEQNRTLEQKVEERTQALREKTNDILNMMQNMHQGLFTIMVGGVIHHEYAAYLEQILGTKKIANHNFMDLLFSQSNLGVDRKDQVATAVDALIGSDEMMFDFNAHLLAQEIQFQPKEGPNKILELDWDPIIADGEIDKIMVTVRDVTELKALQAEAEDQKLELEIIGHILSLDAAKFENFLKTSFQFIDECRALISQTKEKDLDVIATLFRNMHTVKGNARTFGFNYITNSVHEVEHRYDSMRKDENEVWCPEQLLEDLDKAEKDIKRYEYVANVKLGRNEQQSTGQQIASEKVDKLLNSLASVANEALSEKVKRCFKETFETLVSIESHELQSVLQGVVESSKSLAQEVGKPAPKIAFETDGVFIKDDVHSMLNNIFMHVFRNSIDHGIETAEERKAKNKPEVGNIHVKAQLDENCVRFNVRDDGRGLAIGRLFAKAVEKGIYEADKRPSASDIANLIFDSGFSTAEQVTAVSGRGVGMDAVKRFLEKDGGGIVVLLDEGDEMADFRSFSIEISLPNKFYLLTPPAFS